VFAAVAVALFATAIMYLLLLSTPRPQLFFNWIVGLGTVIAVVFPFSSTAPCPRRRHRPGQHGARYRHRSLISQVSTRALRRRVVRRRYTSPLPTVADGGRRYN